MILFDNILLWNYEKQWYLFIFFCIHHSEHRQNKKLAFAALVIGFLNLISLFVEWYDNPTPALII